MDSGRSLSAPAGMVWPLGAGKLLVVLALLWQFYCITLPVDLLVDRIFERDDAFYYFVIARNIVTLGWSTFDGLHDSSGVQLLWTGLLLPLAWAFPGEESFLRSVLVLCLSLNVLTAFLLYRFCRLVHSAVLGDIALVFFAGVLVERWNTLQGMEYPLHLAVLLAVAITGWKLIVGRDDRQALLLGILLALNFWTRLDSVIVSAGVWLLAAIALYRFSPKWPMRVATMTVVPLLAALAYVATSYLMAGTPLPLSGAVKTLYAENFFEGYPPQVALIETFRFWIKVQFIGPLAIIPANLVDMGLGEGFHPMSKPQLVILTLFTFFTLAAGFLALRRHPPGSAERRLLTASVVVLALMLLQSALCVFIMVEFAHVSRHYYGLQLLFWVVWAALLVTLALRALAPRFGRAPALAVTAFAAAAYAQLAHAHLSPPVLDKNYAIARLNLAKDLNRSLPPDAVVGAWNAGVLAYFLDRPVVNLDGLVNDREFLGVLATGTPLASYLRTKGVTYIVDHDRPDLTLRYKQKRGENGEYRNGLLWSEVDIVAKRGSVFVVRLKS